jgi:hypothetical protein
MVVSAENGGLFIYCNSTGKWRNALYVRLLLCRNDVSVWRNKRSDLRRDFVMLKMRIIFSNSSWYTCRQFWPRHFPLPRLPRSLQQMWNPKLRMSMSLLTEPQVHHLIFLPNYRNQYQRRPHAAPQQVVGRLEAEVANCRRRLHVEMKQTRPWLSPEAHQLHAHQLWRLQYRPSPKLTPSCSRHRASANSELLL